MHDLDMKTEIKYFFDMKMEIKYFADMEDGVGHGREKLSMENRITYVLVPSMPSDGMKAIVKGQKKGVVASTQQVTCKEHTYWRRLVGFFCMGLDEIF